MEEAKYLKEYAVLRKEQLRNLKWYGQWQCYRMWYWTI